MRLTINVCFSIVSGYQSYPASHAVAAPPAPATVPVSAAAVAAAAAASAARFPRQPVTLTPANGTFRPSLAPGASPQTGPRPLRPTFNGVGSRGPSPGFHNSKQFRPGFHKSAAFRAWNESYQMTLSQIVVIQMEKQTRLREIYYNLCIVRSAVWR